MSTVNELLQQRAKHVVEMREILDRAEGEKRDLNDTELPQYEKLEGQITELQNRADRQKKTESVEKTLDDFRDKSVKPSVKTSVKNPLASSEYSDAFFNGFCKNKMSGDIRNALEVGVNSEGGFIVPTEFETQLVMNLQDHVELRNYCNVITTSSSRKIPVESSIPTAAWTAEEGTYNDSDSVFAQIQLDAYKATVISKVSEELIADAFFDVGAYLVNAFAKAIGNLEETAFVVGGGSTEPTGIVAGASDSGVTFASSTVPTGDELIDLYHGLGRPYRRNAVFLTSDVFAKAVRKLKDGDGQYLWQTGLQAGQPDMLLGRPVITSSDVVSPATTVKSIVFGDMSNYTIADRSGSSLQRLNELYAATGQIGFRYNKRTDGKVTNSTGIVYADHT
jgi:HK97 family phage major capsid protein